VVVVRSDPAGVEAAAADPTLAGLADVPGIDAVVFGPGAGAEPAAGQPSADVVKGMTGSGPAVVPAARSGGIGFVDVVLENGGGRWRVKQGAAVAAAATLPATSAALPAGAPSAPAAR